MSNPPDFIPVLIEKAVALNETTVIDVHGSDPTRNIKWHHVGKVVHPLHSLLPLSIGQDDVGFSSSAVLIGVYRSPVYNSKTTVLKASKVVDFSIGNHLFSHGGSRKG